MGISLLLKDAPLLVLQRMLNEWHFVQRIVIHRERERERETERERERICEVRARCGVKICQKSVNEYIKGFLTRSV